MNPKTLGNTSTEQAKGNGVQIFGSSEWQLVSKAWNDAEGWMKSTKALHVEGMGCLVQVSTQQRNPDGSYAVAEALTWVPGTGLLAMYGDKVTFGEKTMEVKPGKVINRILLRDGASEAGIQQKGINVLKDITADQRATIMAKAKQEGAAGSAWVEPAMPTQHQAQDQEAAAAPSEGLFGKAIQRPPATMDVWEKTEKEVFAASTAALDKAIDKVTDQLERQDQGTMDAADPGPATEIGPISTENVLSNPSFFMERRDDDEHPAAINPQTNEDSAKIPPHGILASDSSETPEPEPAKPKKAKSTKGRKT